MKPTAEANAIPLKDALRIFWDWRQGSICVEVCFFSRAGSSENVRASIDGVVRLVDSEGIVTVSGDGREIDLDLRSAEIKHAREEAPSAKSLNPLDPDSILQVKFPNGEICLVLPYRRVGYPLGGQRRPETGHEWMQNVLSRSTEPDNRKVRFSGKIFKTSVLDARGGKAMKPSTGKSGPPVFPLAAFVMVFLSLALFITPASVPQLFVELGMHQKMKDPNAPVWVIPQAGNYYCSGSVLNGREPGKFMKQAEALTIGYQPALHHYCQGGDSANSDRGSTGLSFYGQVIRQNGEALLSTLTHMSRSWLPQT